MLILFAGDVDDAEGGAEHFIAKSESIEDLQALTKPTKNNSLSINDCEYHWAHIFDLFEEKIVSEASRKTKAIWQECTAKG